MKRTEEIHPIQCLSAENLHCQRIGEKTYLFTVDNYPDYRLICDEDSDLTCIDTENLMEMEIQMGYNGEMDCTCRNEPRQIGEPFCQREAKFSKTRQQIREEVGRRNLLTL